MFKKNDNKKENRKIENNKNNLNIKKKSSKQTNRKNTKKLPIFMVIGLVILAILVIGIYYLFLNFKEIAILDYEGYAISGKEITETLLGNNSEEDNNKKNLFLTKVYEQDKLYKKLNDYFVGENKKEEINLSYPIYINDNTALYNLSQDMKLITSNFEEISGYPSLTVSNGIVYNESDLERVDEKEYIFLKNESNIFTNLKEIKIQTVANEYTIPVNSNIYFDKEEIRYYEIKKDTLRYKEIKDMDAQTKIKIGEKEVRYEELLTVLRLNQTENQVPTKEEIIEEDTSKENERNQEKVEKEEPEEQQEEEEPQPGAYIKPEVTCSAFKANVYTASTELTIKDPSIKILEPVTFIFRKDGRIYLRKTYTSSGSIEVKGLSPNTSYEIEGNYVYENEVGQKVENTFYKDTITTTGFENLDPITLSFENGEIFSNKIQLKNLKIVSDLQNEAVKGIKRLEVEIGDVIYKLTGENLRKFIAGEAIVYETAEGMKSNQKIYYTIKLYDNQGNELRVENNTGETRTSKQKPSVSIRLNKQNVIDVEIGLNLTNKDNVNLENYRYQITRPNGEVVKESGLKESDDSIYLNDLDPNQYYTITIYASYDLEDNKGKQENQVIGQTVFATQPLSTLGYLELNTNLTDVKTDSGTVEIGINEDRTDKRLIQILDEIKIELVELGKNEGNSNGNNPEKTKEGNVIETITITGEELQSLKQGKSKTQAFENLISNTKYNLNITSKVKQGETIEEVQVTYSLKKFVTLKMPAEVQIKNLFVTGDLIDFDVRVEDLDHAVLTNKVRMELRDEKTNLILLEEINTNEEYIRKTIEKLETGKAYTLSFYADQYNEGNTDETYEANYLLKELKMVTETGITGSIELSNLKRKGTGKNLIDVESKINWRGSYFNVHNNYGKEWDEENRILTLYCKSDKGQGQNYWYDLEQYIGQTVTISFKAKKEGNASIAIASKEGGDSKKLKELSDIPSSSWKEYEYTTIIDESGLLGFAVGSPDSTQAWLYLQELQIELGNQKTKYEEFEYISEADIQIQIEDRKNEIVTKDYYIRIKKEEELINEIRYEELEEGEILNIIKTYPVEENTNYQIELFIKQGEREYILDIQNFDTSKKEIKGIRNEEEWRENLNPEGNYIILGDIELLDIPEGFGYKYRFCSGNYGFQGSIDFNGNKLVINSEGASGMSIIPLIEKEAIIQNLVYEIKLNNKVEKRFGGLFGNNYGAIRNIQVNLIESTNVPNIDSYLLGNQNYGVVENFVIHSKVPLYGAKGLTMGIRNNYGMIQNGYLYGENIKAIYDAPTSNRETGGLTSFNDGTIQNIYSLVNIDLAGKINSEVVGNITAYSDDTGSVVNNVYSVGKGENVDKYLDRGPTVGMIKNAQKITNVYYFADATFQNTYNQKTTMLALRDKVFQSQILNTNNAFEIDSFVENGYYPQIKMPDCMPIQEYIPLPEIEDDDLPDILSTETIEQGTNMVKVKIRVNNPSAETVTDIKVQNISCNILSQTYENGISEVIVELTNPIKYVSTYSVLSITTKGAYNMPYTRTFEEGERYIYADLYREIRSVSDWKEIGKSPTENYMLMEDLDFINEGNSVCINIFEGKLNGNHHTIKNINVTGFLINTIRNELSNLIIENCSVEGSGWLGLINTSNGNLKNIHIKNMKVRRTRDGSIGTIGGLVSVSNGIIEDCSIQGITINDETFSYRTRLGGLVGGANGSTINNCYVQNLKIVANNGYYYEGIGGLIGAVEVKTELDSCYVSGNIQATGDNIGGIVGYLGVGEISNSYSKVNITGNSKKFAGIVTNSGTALISVNQNLSLGNLYTNQKEQRGTRIINGREVSEQNYAFEEQKINGKITEETDGAILLSEEQLKQKQTYQTVFKGNESYSYEEIEKGILPKLYKKGTKELLPNQEDIYLKKEEAISLESIEVEKTAVDEFQGQIVLNNPSGVPVTNIIIDDIKVTILSNRTQNQKTYLTIKGIPTRFYDSYTLSEVTYLENQEEKNQKLEGKVDLQFYKDIYSYEDWQTIEEGTYQNYRLMNDIDFSEKVGIKYDITMAKLVSESGTKTLKNIKITTDKDSSGFIKQITDELRNINFENIEITNTISSGNYTGVIAGSTATIENISFKNIKVQAEKMDFVGCIGYSRGIINRGIIENINCIGKQHVGGLVGYASATITNIQANEINVEGKNANYTGGIVGVNDSVTSYSKIQNSYISGNNWVGGAAGQSYAYQIEAENVEVKGTSYVGGIIGQIHYAGGNGHHLRGDDLTVIGAGERIGGIIGHGTGNYYNEIRNSKIEGTTYNTKYVGGIAGYINGYETKNIIVENVEVITKGNWAGGISGYTNGGIHTSYVVESRVEGNSRVGGAVGEYLNGKLWITYVNADVTAITSTAGGMVGYLNNQGTTAIGNAVRVTDTYTAGGTVKAIKNVGGLIGEIAEELYIEQNFYGNNFTQVDIEGEDQNTVSTLIGNRPDENTNLENTYIYQYSKINGENINLQNEPFIKETQYLKEEDLKKEETYRQKIKLTWDYDFTSLKQNKYPILRGVENQEGIDLPKDSEHMVTNENAEISTLEEEENTNKLEKKNETLQENFNYEGKKIETYETYTKIILEDGTMVTRLERMYVKEGKLYILDGSLDMVVNNFVIDNYNGKEYETILGTDGKLYDLKESLHYPENFKNENIKEIGNNLDTEAKEMTVTYEDGSYVRFNYQTGEVLEEKKVEQKVSLFSYIAEAFEKENVMLEPSKESYEESKDLMGKLEKLPIEEAKERKASEEANSNTINQNKIVENQTMNGQTEQENNLMSNGITSKEKTYISKYNSKTGEYEVYDKEEILESKESEVISEEEKIEKENLNEYYSEEKRTEENAGIVWIMLSIAGAVIILVILGKKMTAKKKKDPNTRTKK